MVVPAMAQVEIDNPSDGGFFYWLLKFYVFGACAVVMAAVYSAGVAYVWFAASAPPLPDLDAYARDVPGVTQVFAHDGTLLADFASERRELVAIGRIPQPLVDAFVAIEDRRFFEHAALDWRGMARALWTNLRAGQIMQGGSTITQQVAKAFLSPGHTLRRKIREAVLSPRADYFHEVSPYFAEHVRRELGKKYGDRAIFEGGLRIETTLLPWVDAAAMETVDFSTRKLDKRQGWRGPEARLSGAAVREFRRRVGEKYGSSPPEEGR